MMNNKGPKISIIIPIYNVEDYVGKCLESVTNQTLKDIEVICVDDGTKDNSCAVVEAYMKEDNRIKLVHKENGGLSSARNYGLQYATGEYTWWIDSDDYIEKNGCERLYDAIQEYHPDLITFGANCIPEYPEPDQWTLDNLSPISAFFDFSKEKPYVEYQDKYALSPFQKVKLKSPLDVLITVFGAYPFVWRSCFRTEFIKENKFLFDESAKFGEDTIYYFDIYPKLKKILFLSDKLYDYRHYRVGSLMFGIKRLDQKIYQHLIIIDYVLSHAEYNGAMKKFGPELFEWTVRFAGYEISTYSDIDKDKFAYQFMQLINTYQLGQYRRELKDELAKYYRVIQINSKNYKLTDR